MEVQQLGGSSAVLLERSVAPGVVFHHPHPKQGTGISRAWLRIYMGVNEGSEQLINPGWIWVRGSHPHSHRRKQLLQPAPRGVKLQHGLHW